MSRFNNVLEAVGATPLIRLNHIGSEFGSEIFVKFEAANPGGSIKDRIGRHIIDAAERKGLLKPGGTIIEATAGNTGAGLALAAAVKGYRLIVVMPDKMSAEKIALLKAFGAEVVITPTAVAPDSPENYIQKAKALAASIPNSFRAAQFENQDNPPAHHLSTGPEIWADMEGRIDALVGGIGTGGTISGTGRFLKEKNPALKVIGADPEAPSSPATPRTPIRLKASARIISPSLTTRKSSTSSSAFPTANRSAPRAAWSARRVFSPAAPPEPRSRNGRCAISAEERAKRGIHDNLIRLSVGLENGDDLTEDLRTALQR